MERLTEYKNGKVTNKCDKNKCQYYDWSVRACTGQCMDDCIKKLAHYEDLEEAGLLLRLKLNVGDIFWELNRAGNGEPYAYPRTAHTLQHVMYCMDHLGKNTFLTAEEALKNLEGE